MEREGKGTLSNPSRDRGVSKPKRSTEKWRLIKDAFKTLIGHKTKVSPPLPSVLPGTAVFSENAAFSWRARSRVVSVLLSFLPPATFRVCLALGPTGWSSWQSRQHRVPNASIREPKKGLSDGWRPPPCPGSLSCLSLLGHLFKAGVHEAPRESHGRHHFFFF